MFKLVVSVTIPGFRIGICKLFGKVRVFSLLKCSFCVGEVRCFAVAALRCISNRLCNAANRV